MTEAPYEYAVLRVVPRVDRGEFVNVGVLVYCQQAGHLQVLRHVDHARLQALSPDVDLGAIRSALDAVEAVCTGAEAAGDAGRQPLGTRFRWLTAPRSTVVQPGPVHAGVTTDPAVQGQRLLERLVH